MCCSKDDAGISASPIISPSSLLTLCVSLPVCAHHFVFFLVVDRARYCPHSSLSLPWFLTFSHGGFWWQKTPGCPCKADTFSCTITTLMSKWETWNSVCGRMAGYFHSWRFTSSSSSINTVGSPLIFFLISSAESISTQSFQLGCCFTIVSRPNLWCKRRQMKSAVTHDLFVTSDHQLLNPWKATTM